MRKFTLALICLVFCVVLMGRARSMDTLDSMPESSYLVMLPHVVSNPTREPTPIPEVGLYDCDGEPEDTTWLSDTFGTVTWRQREGARLVALRCVSGPATLVVHVEDEVGNPLENVTVIRYWPDAPSLPETLAWDGTYNRGIYGPTNVDGNIGFGMGYGDYYFPSTQSGASAVWVGGPSSYLLANLGMLGGTEHAHLDSDWILASGQAPSLQVQNWGFTPGANVRYQDLGSGEPVPIISWTSKIGD